jgi:tRNA(adenine34) deaminase
MEYRIVVARPSIIGRVHGERQVRALDYSELLEATLIEARTGYEEGAEPCGAVIADASGRVLSAGRNRVLTTGDLTAHAEVDAIRAAGTALEGRPTPLIFAISAEPCLMCLGAILKTPITELVWALDWYTNAYAAVSAGAYEPERLRAIRVIREPSPPHRDESRRLLADFYERTGQHHWSRRLRSS